MPIDPNSPVNPFSEVKTPDSSASADLAKSNDLAMLSSNLQKGLSGAGTKPIKSDRISLNNYVVVDDKGNKSKYDPSGTLLSKASFHNNGKVDTETTYDAKARPMSSNSYYEDGKLKSQLEYKEGIADKEKKYDEKGNLKAEVSYKDGKPSEEVSYGILDRVQTQGHSTKRVQEQYSKTVQYDTNGKTRSEKIDYLTRKEGITSELYMYDDKGNLTQKTEAMPRVALKNNGYSVEKYNTNVVTDYNKKGQPTQVRYYQAFQSGKTLLKQEDDPKTGDSIIYNYDDSGRLREKIERDVSSGKNKAYIAVPAKNGDINWKFDGTTM